MSPVRLRQTGSFRRVRTATRDFTEARFALQTTQKQRARHQSAIGKLGEGQSAVLVCVMGPNMSNTIILMQLLFSGAITPVEVPIS
jgi:hypothetical protein